MILHFPCCISSVLSASVVASKTSQAEHADGQNGICQLGSVTQPIMSKSFPSRPIRGCRVRNWQWQTTTVTGRFSEPRISMLMPL